MLSLYVSINRLVCLTTNVCIWIALTLKKRAIHQSIYSFFISDFWTRPQGQLEEPHGVVGLYLCRRLPLTTNRYAFNCATVLNHETMRYVEMGGVPELN